MTAGSDDLSGWSISESRLYAALTSCIVELTVSHLPAAESTVSGLAAWRMTN
jgi:hypothetical protein